MSFRTKILADERRKLKLPDPDRLVGDFEATL